MWSKPRPNQPSDSKYDGDQVIFFGDSITAGVGTTGGNTFPKFAADILGCVVTNKGSSGSDTTRLRAIVQGGTANGTTYTAPDYSNVSACTIMIGTNGGVSGAITDISGVSSYSSYANTFYGNIGSCIEYIEAQNNNIRIYLLTPPKNVDATRTWMSSVVTSLKEIGNYYGLPVIDVFNNCCINSKNSSVFLGDGLHPNNTGSKRIGDYVGCQMTVI